MATEEFKSLKKELYVNYMDFMEFKNSKEANKGKGSSVKPENIVLSFQQYFDNYITWLKSTEAVYDPLDAGDYSHEDYSKEDTSDELESEDKEGSY